MKSSSTQITESAINIIAEGTKVEGKIYFTHLSRIHGMLTGEAHGAPGSTLILKETSVVEGNIHADTLFVDGYVKGDIYASSRVVISASGRVVGKIECPSISIDFGAYFEGQCIMEAAQGVGTSSASPSGRGISGKKRDNSPELFNPTSL